MPGAKRVRCGTVEERQYRSPRTGRFVVEGRGNLERRRIPACRRPDGVFTLPPSRRRHHVEGLRKKSPFVTIYDDAALKTASEWYGGMGDPLYAIISHGGQRIPEEIVERAAFEVGRLYESAHRVKSGTHRGKYQIGQGFFTKKDVDALANLADTLAYALTDPDARYHGD